MNKDWYSATELAGLPGMPSADRVVRLWASKHGWKSRSRSGRGGGKEYHISTLPPETRKHLAQEQAATYINSVTDSPEFQSGAALAQQETERLEAEKNARLTTKQSNLKQFSALPDGPKKQRARARQWVINALREYRRRVGGSKEQTKHDFAEAFNAGTITVPEWVREQMPKYHGLRTLTTASIQRWEDAYVQEGMMGLVDSYGQTKGRSKIETNPKLKEIVLGCLLNQPHITPGKIKQYLEAAHPDLNIVSAKAIERFTKSWKADNAQLWTYITNPDAWKNVYMVAFGSHHEEITYLNQLWEMDSTPADWMLADGRHSVIGVIDMYSRRLKFRVSKTSKASAVALTFRDAVLDWGRPDAVRTDNGQDYVSEHFDSVLDSLDIAHEVCLPFASEEKGTIERSMRTMSHGILDLMPGFIGHNVAERKAIEARKSFAQRVMTSGEVIEVSMTAAELQEKLDQWCEYIYARDPHSGLNKRTPFEMAANWTGTINRINDERALDMLLLDVGGTRTVSKKGIRFEHHFYIAAELVAWVDHEVRVKRDPDDMGRLYVYSQAGEFICVAQSHKVLGISHAEAASAAKSQQKKLLSQQREELKSARRSVKENIAEVVLQHRIDQAGNVTAFPKPSEDYTNPALNAAGEAARANDGPQSTADDLDLESLKHEMQQKPAPVIETDDPRRRYERWVRIGMRIEAGLPVDAEDKRKYENYTRSDEYRSMKSFYEDFGLKVDLEA